MIEIVEISADNLSQILNLSVHDHQKDQVASNAYSVAQGHYSNVAWFRGIFSKDTPVGFVMLEVDASKNNFWIWRFMIDKNHQGKGYGLLALEKVIDFFKTETNAQAVYLSYVPKDTDGPEGFYKKMGFMETGDVDEGEIVMKLTL